MVTPAVYPRLIEFHQIEIIGQRPSSQTWTRQTSRWQSVSVHALVGPRGMPPGGGPQGSLHCALKQGGQRDFCQDGRSS